MSTAPLSARQEELCSQSNWDFSDLSAVFINCTLKKSPEMSHTQGLMDLSAAIMERNGVKVTQFRAVDHVIAPGVWPDMTEHGFERDDWPAILQEVMDANILVLGSSIWLGSSTRAGGRCTATSGPRGTPDVVSTSTIPSIAEGLR